MARSAKSPRGDFAFRSRGNLSAAASKSLLFRLASQAGGPWSTKHKSNA